MIVDTEEILSNECFRRVISTTRTQQLVAMHLLPFEDIGSEVHPYTTQFICVEEGYGTAEVDDERYILAKGLLLTIDEGQRHNISAGPRGMKLYTIYSPPEHRDGLVQLNKPADRGLGRGLRSVLDKR